MKNLLKKIPILNYTAKIVYFRLIAPFKSFTGSEEYWKQRYSSGGASGAGSYDKFANFKAEILNGFVRDEEIHTIIEFGCGDGNQLKLSEYPSYIGFDVSPEAIKKCEEIFSRDETKGFYLMAAYANQAAELALSLDVIYHLIEDRVFLAHMERLFDSSTRFVIIYSSNTNQQERLQAAHVKHRKFSEWVDENRPAWKLTAHIPNKYSCSNDDHERSLADFYIYERSR
jgi:hypothetical protein